MFRLFGTTTSGESESSAGGSRSTPVSQKKGTQRAGSDSKNREVPDERGGFFHLAPKDVPGEESLFDDLEVKPPTAVAAPSPAGKAGTVAKASSDGAGNSTGGALSAFQFMATVPAEAFVSITSPASDAGAAGAANITGDGQVEGASAEISAFSFLSGPALPAGQGDEENANPGSSILGTSSFSFLSQGGDGGGEASAPQAPTNDVSPSINDADDEEIGARGDGAGTAGSASPPLSTKAVSRASSSTSIDTPIAVATAAAGRGGVGEMSGTVNPVRKPSVGVVRKKRTARRVGYAREEILANATSGNSGGASTAKSGLNKDPEESLPLPSSSIGAGISYVPQDGGREQGPALSPSSSMGRGGSGEAGMDDSVVAEAAAMAALAASMAPEDIHEAIAKGDLKQGSSHGGVSETSETEQASSSEGQGSVPGGNGPSVTPSGKSLGMKKSTSFMSKFKGLLSSKSYEEDSASAPPKRSLPETPKEDSSPFAQAGTATDVSPQKGVGGGSYIQPPIYPRGDHGREDTRGNKGGSPRKMDVEGEGTALLKLQSGLSSLVNDFREKSKFLSDRLAEAAAERPALQANRACTAKAHADGIRRLVEVEAEQQRLADAEDFEKAAELSVDIDRLKSDSEAAARRLRELDREEALLEKDASEGKMNLLRAVEDSMNALKVFQGRQDGKLGRLVADRTAQFEAEHNRMNTEADRIAMEKTHVEKDSAHLEEELAQTESAISSQTGGEDGRIDQLALMRMELEAEVKELEAQLQAKKDALREVMVGLEEAETRIDAVRGKFERQLLRLRERERLVAVSREDCKKEEEALEKDRARHHVEKEKATREQQSLVEAVAGVAQEVELAAILQTTLTNYWDLEATVSGDSEGVDVKDDAASKLAALRSEVEAARSRHDQSARSVAGLEEKRDDLLAERDRNSESLPELEQSKKAAVAAKNYKEAAQLSRQMKETERRQQEVSELLLQLEASVAEGSDARKDLAAMKAELSRSEEALRGAEQEVAVSRIAVLEKRAKPLRRACRAIKAKGSVDGLRDTAESLLILQLSSLETEAKDIAATYGLSSLSLSLPQGGDSDSDSDVEETSAEKEGKETSGGDEETEASAAPEKDDTNEAFSVGDASDASPSIEGGEAAPQEEEDSNPAAVAARELLAAETAEVEREIATLDSRLAEALASEDYDLAAELDEEMSQMRTRLADFAAEAETMGGSSTGQDERIVDGEREKEAVGASKEDSDGEVLNPSAVIDLDLEENEEGGVSGDVDRRSGSMSTVSGDGAVEEGGSDGGVEGNDSVREEAACEVRQDAEVVGST